MKQVQPPPARTALTQEQIAENKRKIGISMFKQGLESRNYRLIDAGIIYLKMAAKRDEQARHTLIQIKCLANPGVSKIILLEDPSTMNFDAWEIDRLCTPSVGKAILETAALS